MPDPQDSEGEDYSLWDDGDSATETEVAVTDALVLTVGQDGAARLDKWLAQQLTAYSRVRLQQWIEAGAVEVDGRPASARARLYADQVVTVIPQAAPEETAFRAEDVPLVVVAEDDSLLVIDKPAGLVVHPAAGNWSGTLLNGLLQLRPALAAVPRAGIVHRLDKDTSGLLVVAKTLTAQTALIRQLQARSVHREYLAVVVGAPPASLRIDAPIGRDPRERTRMAVLAAGAHGAKPAITHFEVVRRAEAQGLSVALLRLRLETGRTHQIRVHLSQRGWPIAGDPLYARGAARGLFSRQALHARVLALAHPDDGRPMRWVSRVPDDMAGLLTTLGLQGPLDD